uniref:Nuclear cap-binding protein subunit 2 n=1 Tax=Bartheletia paradoxa TaxID=669517 RepID=A0A2D0XI16_9BASI|nr:hypothetical protein SPAR02431 [Bartheletia paradoxa]
MNVCEPLDTPSSYRDAQSNASQDAQYNSLMSSSTLYVGNLSFFTTEEQIYELFAKCASSAGGGAGGVKRIIMGLDRNNKTPCGFAFVEYYTPTEAREALRYVSGTKLDERIIRCDLDPGYKEGRQFGRGRSGGQVRDEHRAEYDPGRGGWGHKAREAERLRQEREREAQQTAVYADRTQIPEGAEDEWQDEGRGVAVEDEGTKKRGRSEGEEQDEEEENPRFRSKLEEADEEEGEGGEETGAEEEDTEGVTFEEVAVKDGDEDDDEEDGDEGEA